MTHESLQVYEITASGRFCGGMALVAAANQDEAVKLASLITGGGFYVHYAIPDKVRVLPLTYFGVPAVITHYENGE